MTLQVTGFTFTRHIEDRIVAAIKATMEIRNLTSLSLGTSIALFKLKIAPVASYAIEIIWSYLSYQNLKILDRLRPDI